MLVLLYCLCNCMYLSINFYLMPIILVTSPTFSNCLSPSFHLDSSTRPVATITSVTNTTANVSWTVSASLPTQCNDRVVSLLPLSFFVDLNSDFHQVTGYPMVRTFCLFFIPLVHLPPFPLINVLNLSYCRDHSMNRIIS